jgi:hypothetical protein
MTDKEKIEVLKAKLKDANALIKRLQTLRHNEHYLFDQVKESLAISAASCSATLENVKAVRSELNFAKNKINKYFDNLYCEKK